MSPPALILILQPLFGDKLCTWVCNSSVKKLQEDILDFIAVRLAKIGDTIFLLWTTFGNITHQQGRFRVLRSRFHVCFCQNFFYFGKI
jgi:hypothetical protein